MNDMITGVHSVLEAIKNPKRKPLQLYCTRESISELMSKGKLGKMELEKIPTIFLAPHELQEKAKFFCKKYGYLYKRITSNIFLLATSLPQYDLSFLLEMSKQGRTFKILCLDQITDIQNAAAILRTAAFYGVDYLLVSFKGAFGMGPGFSRMASGALEHVPIVKCASLPKALSSLRKNAVFVLGFSEHANISLTEILDKKISRDASLCLVLGAEDVGLSSAVTRVLDDVVAIKPKGPIKSLNVSVAAGLAMDRVWGS